MKSLILKEIGHVELVDRPEPTPGPNQLLVKLRVCSIGAEHVYSLKGECCYVRQSPRNPYYRGTPMTFGGEMVGEVVSVGSEIKNFKAGDRIAGWSSFEEYVLAGSGALKVPEHVSDEEAVFVSWGGTTLHAVHRARILLGDRVAVLGQGPLGLLVTQWARLSGALDLIGVDLRASRLHLARDLGATAVIQPGKEDLDARVKELTDGEGVDVAIEASGVPSVLEQAIMVARNKGRIVALGWYQNPVTLHHWVADVYHKEVDLVATRAAGYGDSFFPMERSTSGRNSKKVLRMIAEGKIRVRPIVSHVLPVGSFEEAFRLESEKPEGALKVLLRW
ncbi:MAG: zinc-binding dehydrogenase [Planctomycetes bacterium]|nr:zinc-binding dehydrogenase [Planctomycetota bacterium]